MSEPWYQDGLQFRCTRCGNCCTGAPGYGGISLYGYPLGIAMAADGFGVIWELRGTLYVAGMFGRGADARNAQKGLKPFQILVVMLFVIVHTSPL